MIHQPDQASAIDRPHQIGIARRKGNFLAQPCRRRRMEKSDTVIAVFPGHNAAEAAVKKLATAGFDMKKLSVVGRGYHTEEKVVGFYNIGDRITFWGIRGAFWGGLWGLFLGGLFVTIPAVGPVIFLGYIAATAIVLAFCLDTVKVMLFRRLAIA
jgi:hypothetical protein